MRSGDLFVGGLQALLGREHASAIASMLHWSEESELNGELTARQASGMQLSEVIGCVCEAESCQRSVSSRQVRRQRGRAHLHHRQLQRDSLRSAEPTHKTIQKDEFPY